MAMRPLADPMPHLVEILDTVGVSEQIPGLGHLQWCEAAVEPATDDSVVRMVSLEEERLPDSDPMKSAAATGAPEVDLVQICPAREEPIPVPIGNRDVGLHACTLPDLCESLVGDGTGSRTLVTPSGPAMSSPFAVRALVRIEDAGRG
jgi:hypothetical protein